jgi:uncharacterized protein (TIGR02145 family)
VQITGDGSANKEPVGLTLTSSGQVESGTNGYGKFILAGDAPEYDWSNSATRNNRWSNGSTSSNRTSDIAHSSWTFGAQPPAGNNPCPGGWSVPSTWQWKDMREGDGSSTTPFDNAWRPAAPINNWVFRPAHYGTVGGAIITNAAGEKVFLPAAGGRYGSSGFVYDAGSGGNYWSSSPFIGKVAHYLYIHSGYVGTYNDDNRADGHSVRCVTE